jgi:hypothetical protein
MHRSMHASGSRSRWCAGIRFCLAASAPRDQVLPDSGRNGQFRRLQNDFQSPPRTPIRTGVSWSLTNSAHFTGVSGGSRGSASVGAHTIGANLNSADLSVAHLKGANLSGAQLSEFFGLHRSISLWRHALEYRFSGRSTPSVASPSR